MTLRAATGASFPHSATVLLPRLMLYRKHYIVSSVSTSTLRFICAANGRPAAMRRSIATMARYSSRCQRRSPSSRRLSTLFNEVVSFVTALRSNVAGDFKSAIFDAARYDKHLASSFGHRRLYRRSGPSIVSMTNHPKGAADSRFTSFDEIFANSTCRCSSSDVVNDS